MIEKELNLSSLEPHAIVMDPDYETLPTSSLSSHMMAGAAAGIMEHCVMYPIDSVKTRMQSMRPNPHANYNNIFDALYKMIRFEGIWRPVRGINAVALGAGPAHALYFAAYERAKIVFGGGKPNSNPLAHGMAGCLATLLHDSVMNPAEVVKQRMQMYNSPYKSCLHCTKEIYRTEGFRAFYRSYITQLTMNIPFQSIHFMVYEFMQETLNAERTYNPKTHVASGAIAGAVAAAITTPLDVCKTLLNTQEKCALTHQNPINGMTQAIQTIYRFQGFSGYFKGAQARVIYQMPSTAISWSVYEFFKHIITEKQRTEDRYTPTNVAVAASAR